MSIIGSPLVAARPATVTTQAWVARDSAWLIAIGTLALGLRLLFYTGFMGSDEVTYFLEASAISNGEWPRTGYIGALRYGINIPIAIALYLFGPSQYAANAWALACSIGEVLLTFLAARLLWGRREAILSALVLALVPLHVNIAGRLLADAPLAFFITATFVTFLLAERTQRAGLYFAAGLIAGCVFWIKEVAMVFLLVFPIYAAMVARSWNGRWLVMACGVTVMVVANCALQWMVAGDPLLLIRVILATPDKYIAAANRMDSSPLVYFRYLFFDARHTWIMPFLALGGVVTYAVTALVRGSRDAGMAYVLVWALGLLAVFSFLPIALRPFTLIAKQSNYMTIFLAPLAVISGWLLARLSAPVLIPVMALLVLGSVALAGLEQQSIRVFTANSKAAVAFARAHPDVPVYGMTNAFRAGVFAEIEAGHPKQTGVIRDLTGLTSRDLHGDGRVDELLAIAVLDWETATWGRVESIRTPADVPACWHKTGTLDPVGYGAGARVVDAGRAGLRLVPDFLRSRAEPVIAALASPRPADTFAIPAGCEFDLGPGRP